MATFLLTWNPEYWNIDRTAAEVAAHGEAADDWRTQSRKVRAGELVRERRHSFDVGWPYRITVSIDDGPEMGPKLQVSIGRVDARGDWRPLRGPMERFAPLVLGFLREVAGVTEEPLWVLTRGPKKGIVGAYHFFFPFTALPSPN